MYEAAIELSAGKKLLIIYFHDNLEKLLWYNRAKHGHEGMVEKFGWGGGTEGAVAICHPLPLGDHWLASSNA